MSSHVRLVYSLQLFSLLTSSSAVAILLASDTGHNVFMFGLSLSLVTVSVTTSSSCGLYVTRGLFRTNSLPLHPFPRTFHLISALMQGFFQRIIPCVCLFLLPHPVSLARGCGLGRAGPLTSFWLPAVGWLLFAFRVGFVCLFVVCLEGNRTC